MDEKTIKAILDALAKGQKGGTAAAEGRDRRCADN